MNLRGVIFDLDGTLGDTLPICFAAFRRALGSAGVHMTDAEVLAHFGPTEEGIVRRLVLPEHAERAVKIYQEEYVRAHDQSPAPFAGIPDALRLLRERGVRLAVGTGKGRFGADVSLRRFGIAEAFEIVVAGSDDGGVKPQIIRQILAQWQMPPEHAAYVGDVPTDIDAARETGVRALAAAWRDDADPDALRAQSPDALFETVADLIAWIEGLSFATEQGGRE